jgi:hypothetical protein
MLAVAFGQNNLKKTRKRVIIHILINLKTKNQ